MGYDSSINIKKKNIKEISSILNGMGFEIIKTKKSNKLYLEDYKFYLDDNYKYFEGVRFYIVKVDGKYYLGGRNSIYCSDYDLIMHNNVLKKISKRYNISFETDEGENKYFKIRRKPYYGLVNGLYFTYWKVYNQVQELRFFQSSIPMQTESEKNIQELFGACMQREIYGNNLCIIHLVTIMELYFKYTFITLLKVLYSEQYILSKFKINKYNRNLYNNGKISLYEAVANSYSFQNIKNICDNFKKINSGIDLENVYKKMKGNYYKKLDNIFVQRHNNVHRLFGNENYKHNEFTKDAKIVEKSIEQCYIYLCKFYKVKKQI